MRVMMIEQGKPERVKPGHRCDSARQVDEEMQLDAGSSTTSVTCAASITGRNVHP